MNTVGCFGSVVYHDPEGRRCNACPLLDKCKEEVVTNRVKLDTALAAIKTADKSTAKARKRAMKVLASDSEPTKPVATMKTESSEKKEPRKGSNTSALNVKAAEFVNRWEAKGLDFASYKDGHNPFVLSGNKFAMVAMQYLMEHGSCTKLEMTDHLIANAGGRGPWGPGTAGSHANIVFEAFEHLGIVAITGGKAYLVR